MESNGQMSSIARALNVALPRGKQEIDPGMYILEQGGTEVGRLAVIYTGSTTRAEHWFLYTQSGTSPTRAPFTFPGQSTSVSIQFDPNGSDPGTTFNAANYRLGLGIQNKYISSSTTDHGVA